MENKSTIIPALRYRNAPAAIDWFCDVLGFERRAVFAGPGNTIAHAELTLKGGMIMLGSARDDEEGRRFQSPLDFNGVETSSAYIIVPDAAEAFEKAKFAQSNIVKPIYDTHYGSREFCVKDLEGHTWTVGTYNPWSSPDPS